MSEGGGGTTGSSAGNLGGLLSIFDPDFWDFSGGPGGPQLDNVRRELQFQSRQGFQAPTGACRDVHLPARNRWLREQLGPDGMAGVARVSGGPPEIFFGVIPTGLSGEPRHRCMDRIRQVRAPAWLRFLEQTGGDADAALDLLKRIGRGDAPAFGGVGQVSLPPNTSPAPTTAGPPGSTPNTAPSASQRGLELLRAARRGVSTGTEIAGRLARLRQLAELLHGRRGAMPVGNAFIGGSESLRLPGLGGGGGGGGGFADVIDATARALQTLGLGRRTPVVSNVAGRAAVEAARQGMRRAGAAVTARDVGAVAGGAVLGEVIDAVTDDGGVCIAPREVQRRRDWPTMFRAAEHENGTQVYYRKQVVTSGDLRKLMRDKDRKSARARSCRSRCRPR